MIDIDLDKYLDIDFTESGDLKATDKIDTAIITALFSNKKKSWFINNDYEASYLYLTDQTRLNSETLLNLRVWSRRALQFLIDDEGYNRIDTDVKIISSTGKVKLIIKIYKKHGDLESREYIL